MFQVAWRHQRPEALLAAVEAAVSSSAAQVRDLGGLQQLLGQKRPEFRIEAQGEVKTKTLNV